MLSDFSFLSLYVAIFSFLLMQKDKITHVFFLLSLLLKILALLVLFQFKNKS
jgi:hypothetical protein